MSATPAREGLLILKSEGFLEVVPRRGFVVSPLSPDDVNDMFAAQALLAGELGARAASRMTDVEFAELEHIQKQLEEAADAGDMTEVESLNYAFHRRIYQMAKSPKIHWLLKATLGYAPRTFYPAIQGWPEATLHDHADVLTALRARDSEAARAAMSNHLRSAGRLLAQHLVERSQRDDESADEPQEGQIRRGS